MRSPSSWKRPLPARPSPKPRSTTRPPAATRYSGNSRKPSNSGAAAAREERAMRFGLSGSRLDCGVGKGYRWNEFAGFCVDMEEADGRFNEALEVITKSFASDTPFSHRGRYWQYDNIVVEPPSAQRPHPPFWMGAGSTRSVREVVERGYNLLLGQYDLPDQALGFVEQFKRDVEARGRAFDPMQVGVAR